MPSLPPRFSFNPPRKPKGSSGWSYTTSAAERGYGAAWRKLRARILKRDPLCVPCRANGHVTASTEVDHVKPKAEGGSDADDNLQGICTPCHRAKTAADNSRARQADRHFVPRPRA